MTPFKVILVFLAVCSMISLIKCAGNESIVPTCECIFLVPLIIFGKRVTYDNCAKYRDYKTCLQADVNCNVDKAKTNNPDLEKECDELAPQPPNPSQSGQPIVTQVPTQHPTLAVTNTSTEHCGKKCEPPVNVTDGKLDMPELMPAGKKKKEKKAHDF
ncbi:hypothetical protein DdX_20527 [Ditylenchus destructor]|uniref:Uncharacterized protein n=1 Tax=Ditylenchus destructor TaxID=166010 RepID=A0AAD4QW36_9BILA|nr:hypothetical protein DdX_20527 [Ditylenchus destructor]